MLIKLALKNIRKSLQDYSIYFFTLVVAVAIFYIFNSMEAQEVMLSVSSSKTTFLRELSVLLGNLSLVISVILGFLIVYANNFLVKRRKKEI